MVHVTRMARLLSVTACVIALAALVASCSVGAVVGSGKSATETREIKDVNAVELSAVGELTITQGDKESLVITGDDNILPIIETGVNNHVLSIGARPNTILQSIVPLRYELMVKNIDNIMLSGLGNVKADKLNSDKLSLTLSGAGKLEVSNLAADELDVKVSGLGDATLSGEAKNQTAMLSGAGNYVADELKSDVATVNITGLGNAKVWVTEDLTANLTGAGTIEYYGKPAVDQSISGVGSIKSLGNK